MEYVIKEVYASGSSVIINGDVWDDGNCLGTKPVALSAIQVMWIITDEELTEPQKKAAIRDLVVTQIQSWRLTEAHDAVAAVKDLAPEFPITLTFDPAPLPEPPENGGESQAFNLGLDRVQTPSFEISGNLFDKVKGWFR